MDDGSVWFGGDNGISVFKNEKVRNTFSESVFKQQAPINCLYKDSKNAYLGLEDKTVCVLSRKTGTSIQITYYKLPIITNEKETICKCGVLLKIIKEIFGLAPIYLGCLSSKTINL
jgi:hypothetical protein